MKNSKNILLVAVVLLVAVLATVFMSCTPPDQYIFDLQGQDGLAKDAPTLLVATNAEFPPFESKERGKIIGADIAIINAIGTKLGMKVKIKHMAFDSVLAAMENEKYDAAVAGLTIDEERKEKMFFTSSYFSNTQVLVVKKENVKFDNATDANSVVKLLENTNVHVAKGQVGQYFVAGGGFGYEPILGATAKINASVALAMQGIVGDEAAIMDREVALRAVLENPSYKVVDIPLTEEEYAIAVNKQKAELYAKIEQALQDIIADGTMAEIKEYYNII